MSSLKEVKNRIATVSTTRKITQARGAVSSALLVRSQAALSHARRYLDALGALPYPEWGGGGTRNPPPDAPTAIVVAAGAGGMAGAFNSRMERRLAEFVAATPGEKVVYPLGVKMRDATRRATLPTAGEFDALAGKPSFEHAAALAATLVEEFVAGRIRGVEMLWYDFVSMGRYELTESTILPLPSGAPEANAGGHIARGDEGRLIVEPSADALAGALLPLLCRARLWHNIVSTAASEHAARVIAMRGATDNADRLLTELQLTYNKLRQQNITSELLDIIGSSFA